MKYFLWLLLVTGALYAQPMGWNTQNPAGGGDFIISQIADNGQAYAYKSNYLLRSTNWGKTWKTLPPFTADNIENCFFMGHDTGFVAIGQDVWRTVDGGINWLKERVANFYGALRPTLYIYNKNLGFCWYAAIRYRLYRTTDGGQTWPFVMLPSLVNQDSYFDLSFCDSLTGWMASQNSGIIKTTDGGLTWRKVNQNEILGIVSLSFINSLDGWVVTYDGKIYRTGDGGTNWSLISTVNNSTISSVKFLDANTGILIAGIVDSIKKVFSSSDGGITWRKTYEILRYSISKPKIVSDREVMIVVDQNVVLHTLDGGLTWRDEGAYTRQNLNSIYFADSLHGCAAGDSGTALYTTNGGEIWEAGQHNSVKKLNAVTFSNYPNGYIAGDSGTLMKTTDGGRNWSGLYSGVTCDLFAVSFPSANAGYAAGDSGLVIKTTDAGASWMRIYTGFNQKLNSCYFINENEGWVCATWGKLLHTINGGMNWNILNYNAPVYSFFFIDSNTGWIGSEGKILKTTNAGASWVSANIHSSYTVSNISFTDMFSGWALASENDSYSYSYRILRTVDGGLTWYEVNTGITTDRKLNSFSFPTAHKGWIAGQGGLIMKNEETASNLLTWRAQIKLLAGDEQQYLTMGTSPRATDGIDTLLGEQAVSVPPAVFHAGFVLPGGLYQSYKDFRSDTSGLVVWKIRFQRNNAAPLCVMWDSTLLPAGTFTIKANIFDSLKTCDMHSANSFAIMDPAVNEAVIEYSAEACLTQRLNGGWQIISVPVIAENMNASALYNNTASPFYTCRGNYILSNTLETGRGYFVKGRGIDYSVCGRIVSKQSVHISAGWNLIGTYHYNVPVSAVTSQPPGIIKSSFSAFDTGSGYVAVSELKSASGYWVKSSAEGELLLPLFAINKSCSDYTSSETVKSQWGKIYAVDKSGAKRVLYVSGKPLPEVDESGKNYELPPIPPAGIFDVRFGSMNFADCLNPEQSILINSAEFPVTISAEGCDILLRDKATMGRKMNARLADGVSVLIEDPAITEIMVQGKFVPVSFSLDQNFPNPFNPVTTLRFTLPEKTHVRLSVHNALGQKVAELLNEEKDRGEHKIIWDARGAASGVYFYSLSAGKFSAVKKAILLK